jgi:alpha-aminoadipate carrier protein LysW
MRRHLEGNPDGGFILSTCGEMIMYTQCPECEADVTIPAGVVENELISCPDCGAELEIISLNPLQVELAPEVEEDWGE